MISANTDAWQSARKLLCIRLDSLGDVLMTTPAIRALKETCPGREITLLTSPQGAKVAPFIPEVDDVIVFDAPWVKSNGNHQDSRSLNRMARQLKHARYDAAVIFTVFSQNPLPSAMLAYWANIPLRLAHCRENPYHLLTNWVPETDGFSDTAMRHEVRRQLDLVAAVGYHTRNERLTFQIPKGVRPKVRKHLTEMGVDTTRPWLVIHPGATAASRRYRPDSFAAVARSLVLEHGFQVIFTGSGWEQELVETIQMTMDAPSFSLVNQLSLEEFGGLLFHAPLLISNNSGPVHIAAAVGTPVVDLYALTNPQHTPWKIPHKLLNYDVPCKFCYKSVCPLVHNDCLAMVAPGQVVQAALDLLQENGLKVHKIGMDK